jgi:hypothetical protein
MLEAKAEAPDWLRDALKDAIASLMIKAQVSALNHCGTSLDLGQFYVEDGTIFAKRFADGEVEEIETVAIGLHHLAEAYPRDLVMSLFREGLDLFWEGREC